MKTLRFTLTLILISQVIEYLPDILDNDATISLAQSPQMEEGVEEKLFGNYHTNLTYDKDNYPVNIDINQFKDSQYEIHFEKSHRGDSYKYDGDFLTYVTYIDGVLFLYMESTYHHYFAKIGEYPNGDLKLRFITDYSNGQAQLTELDSRVLLSYFKKHLPETSFYPKSNINDMNSHYLRENSIYN